MKLFMEINPTLFDECSAEYAAHQEGAEARAQERQNRWKTLEDSAKRHRPGGQLPRAASPMVITHDDAEHELANGGNPNGRDWAPHMVGATSGVGATTGA